MEVTRAKEVKRLLKEAKELAIAQKAPMTTTGHLLEAMLTDDQTEVAQFFNKMQLNRNEMVEQLHRFYPEEGEEKTIDSPRVKESLVIAAKQVEELHHAEMTSMHLLLALFMQEKTIAQAILTAEHHEWNGCSI